MLGTGLFTSLGFQVAAGFDSVEIALLWGLGGVLVLLGSMSYSGLWLALPGHGGEAHFIYKLYGKTAGRATGLISVVAGFAAPLAAAAMALASYGTVALGYQDGAHVWLLEKALALAALGLVWLVQGRGAKSRTYFQNIFVLVKVAVVLVMIFFGWRFFLSSEGASGLGRLNLLAAAGNFPSLFSTLGSSAFTLSLVYVSYAYSGWNAAVYVTDDIRDVQRTLPRAMVWGPAAIVFLSIAFNLALYVSVPREMISGRPEAVYVVAQSLLGDLGAQAVGAGIGLGLLSAISAMFWAGSRVVRKVANDLRLEPEDLNLDWSRWVLGGLAAILVVSASFQFVLEVGGFCLTLCSMLCGAGVPALYRQGRAGGNRRAWIFSGTAVSFVLFSGLILLRAAQEAPTAFCLSLCVFIGSISLVRALDWYRAKISWSPAPSI